MGEGRGVGDIVKARASEDDPLLYEGVIVAIHEDATFDIDFGEEAEGADADPGEHKLERVDIGDVFRQKPWDALEEGDRVKARHGGGRLQYEAVVEAVRPDGTYDLRYDDGDAEQAVERDLIVKQASHRTAASSSGHSFSLSFTSSRATRITGLGFRV